MERPAKPRYQRVAAYAVIVEARRILLCRLSKKIPRWEGFWTLPGGGLHFGERPEDALRREVEEETGLRVTIRSIAGVDSVYDASGGTDFHGIRIIYRADIVGGTLRHEADGTTDLCAWHALEPGPATQLVDLAEVGIGMARKAPGGAP